MALLCMVKLVDFGNLEMGGTYNLIYPKPGNHQRDAPLRSHCLR